jgi:sugar phosphate isomerase/epimerase
MRLLSLHHLVATEISAAELVEVAADVGADRVCLFVQSMPGAMSFPLVGREDATEVRRVMDLTGVSACNLEFFGLTPDVDIESFRPALEVGARLGATRATALAFDSDSQRLADHFSQFYALTPDYGIDASIEFMPLTPLASFAQAVELVRSAGHADRTVALDMIHMVRTGGLPSDLVTSGSELIGYVQLCDGPNTAIAEYREEAVHNRMPPGEGEWPLAAFLKQIPADVPLSVEVPMDRLRDRGVGALARARIAVQAARKLIDVVDGL